MFQPQYADYTSPSDFRKPLEKQNGKNEQEKNCWLEWDGMSKAEPKPQKNGANRAKEIGPLTLSRVRDHFSSALERSETKKGVNENDGVTVVSRHASNAPCVL